MVKYCRATLSVLSFHSFLCPLSPSFILPRCSHVPPHTVLPSQLWPSPCPGCLSTSALFVSLVCLHPSLPSFSPIFLLGCIASQPFLSSFIFLLSSFFLSTLLLFNEPSCSHKLATAVVVLSMPMSPDHTGMLV